MQATSRTCLALSLATFISACGGGSGSSSVNNTPPPPPPSDNYDLQAGVKGMVDDGLNANVTLNGTVTTNGVSTGFTGTGTFQRPAGVSTTFNGSTALAQTTTVAGTVNVGGTSQTYSTTVTDYYAADGAILGEVSNGEYDVSQQPIEFPTMVVGGSSGVLGTLSRYTDSTMSVSLGTVQVSYAVAAPTSTGGPVSVALTTDTFDTHSTLVETDVTNYNMTSSNVITLIGATGQSQTGTITITAQ